MRLSPGMVLKREKIGNVAIFDFIISVSDTQVLFWRFEQVFSKVSSRNLKSVEHFGYVTLDTFYDFLSDDAYLWNQII